MKKILFLVLSLIIYSAISFGQDSLSIDTTTVAIAHKNEFSTVNGEMTKSDIHS